MPRRVPLARPISSASIGYFRSAGFYFRVGAVGIVTLVVFGILGLRLWSLQFLRSNEYSSLARRQAYRTVELPTARGPVVDAKGRVLVQSDGRLALTVNALTLGRVSRDGLWWQPSPWGRRRLAHVARLVHLPLRDVLANVRRSVIRSPYAPAIVAPRLSRQLAFYVEERSRDFAGFHVSALPDRQYPQGSFGSEFLGLLGQISPDQLEEHHYRGYRPGEVIGQSGVEASYDRLLNGGLQRARVPVDSVGRPIGRERLLRRAHPPRALRLTIRSDLQRVAERAIRDGIQFAGKAGHHQANAGAAVVMNPWTGAIYALASYPSFSQVAAAKNPRYYSRLINGAPPGLVDRAAQGVYPLGSTFKPIVAAAALHDGLITPYTPIPCTGSLTVGNTVFHNVEPGVNATLDLPQALSISCDTWFYRLGVKFYEQDFLGMQRWAHLLGLGRPTGVDVAGEATGLVPTPAWLRRTAKYPWQRIWYEGYSVNLSIGQGQLQVTPLQLAVAYSALANGGTVVRPHVGDAVLGPSGQVLRKLRFPPARRLHLRDTWAIHQGLFAAAHEGTSAAIFSNFQPPVAGKTGTAQTGNGDDHSWYASWAPAGSPRVVVVVLIEHGGFGAEAAAPAVAEREAGSAGRKYPRASLRRNGRVRDDNLPHHERRHSYAADDRARRARSANHGLAEADR